MLCGLKLHIAIVKLAIEGNKNGSRGLHCAVCKEPTTRHSPNIPNTNLYMVAKPHCVKYFHGDLDNFREHLPHKVLNLIDFSAESVCLVADFLATGL